MALARLLMTLPSVLSRSDHQQENEMTTTFTPRLNGQDIVLWDVWTRVNPNAHNVRYGRNCRDPAVVAGQVVAGNEADAMVLACAEYGYNPEVGQYEYLVDKVTRA